MNPMLQEKLLDLLVNIIAIILGGGFITLVIEWRRHKREMANWQREDATIQIDIPRSDMMRSRWVILKDTTDKQKLMIYENHLEKTIRQIVVSAEFVVRNTTAAEIIVTEYSAELVNIPSGLDIVDFYDLETFDLESPDDIGAIRLKPFGTIPRALIYVARFDKNRRLEEESLPTTLVISVRTSSGKVIQQSATLNVKPGLSSIEVYQGKIVPTKYYQKFVPDNFVGDVPPEDDIPF